MQQRVDVRPRRRRIVILAIAIRVPGRHGAVREPRFTRRINVPGSERGALETTGNTGETGPPALDVGTGSPSRDQGSIRWPSLAHAMGEVSTS